MKPLYIIPARGGSKGIPRKNIRLLGGKPLIAYTISVAQEVASRRGGYILLSTDDVEIAETARTCGLSVEYMRPACLGADTTSSRDVMLDAMAWADAKGIDYDAVVLLQPTSPLRRACDVEGTMDAFRDGVEMAVSVVRSDANPYYNLFECDSNGFLHICKGSGLLTRRQDAPPVWEYNGAVYVVAPEAVRRRQLGEFERRIPYEMPAERSIDLDTIADWNRAEEIFKNPEL